VSKGPDTATAATIQVHSSRAWREEDEEESTREEDEEEEDSCLNRTWFTHTRVSKDFYLDQSEYLRVLITGNPFPEALCC
jgi:hypothetical protein